MLLTFKKNKQENKGILAFFQPNHVPNRWNVDMMAVSSSDMALDDIKKADEIISMAILNSNSASSAPKKKAKFLSTLSLNQKKPRRMPQRQYSNAFPCPMIRSETLESPEGSVSSLGLVHSSPFASLAMTSVYAKRARSAYRASRTVSDQANAAQNEVLKQYF